MREFRFVSEGNARLRDFLRARFSYTALKHMRQCAGAIRVNGRAVNVCERLNPGDVVEVSLPELCAPQAQPEKLELRVVFEDGDLLIISKGPGIACMVTNGHERDNLLSGLAYLYPGETFRVVTRLDRDTSGLVLVARNAYVHSCFSRDMHRIGRCYRALCEGKIERDLTVSLPIARGEDIRRIVSEAGKPAITHVHPVRELGPNTLAECTLETGRTHQIRVHMAAIGHPVVGDTLYGSGKGDYNTGQQLECFRLEFTHPVTGQALKFEIPEQDTYLKDLLRAAEVEN